MWSGLPYPRESEIVDGSFQPVQEILRHLDDFEMWSQICLRALFKVSARGLTSAGRGDIIR